MRRGVGAVIAASLLWGSPALAQSKSAVTAAELEAILADAGLAASLVEDAATGAPVASAQAGPVQFWVRALDCAGAPKACSTLVFFANFELGRASTQKDYEIVNRFNDGQVFGRAYIVPGRNQVGVDYVIELDGGVSMEHIAANVGRWTDVIGAFMAHFSAAQATS